jgi:predicted glycogen debranching enzyme
MEVLQRIDCRTLAACDPDALVSREWLATNGNGGYASGTVSGACTRRYHSLLVAALPGLGRTVMFNHLAETLKLAGGEEIRLSTEELLDTRFEPFAASLAEFRLEAGLPVWRYEIDSILLEKRLLLTHTQNTVHLSYKVLKSPSPVRLRLRPSFHFRPHDASVSAEEPPHYNVTAVKQGFEVFGENFPPLRIFLPRAQASLVLDGGQYRRLIYRIEQARGYDAHGILWTPGYFRVDLRPGAEATLVASTESWDMLRALDHAAAWDAEYRRRERLLNQAEARAQSYAPHLVLAADQFLVHPVARPADSALARAAGDEVRTVIAGYHWFTDWGRDTMISLEGLTLTTGRQTEAGYILRTFGRYVKDGLIPNLFPEGKREGLYHTADATLWYFHALHRYVERTQDFETLEELLPTLRDIVAHHIRGTHFGIHVDSADGLLSQGAAGYQLTWMDAKVGDWVVTPRRGKAVEINALWYNALRLLERWVHGAGDTGAANELAHRAEQVCDSFNRRFWIESQGYLYDVIDGESGDDDAFRPNQVFAISLDHPVLDQSRWKTLFGQVHDRLLTPFGLRSLAPGHPEYCARYDGDLRSRDAAYHQGTVWAWLIGPFIDAWLRVHPDQTETACDFLAGFESHLSEAGIGTISEVFDAEAPYYPRGCIAQAWSVAEVLRCRARIAKNGEPNNS